MDLSTFVGGSTPKEEQKPAIEYTAQVSSPLVSGESVLTITDSALTISSLFDTDEVTFAAMNALELADYVVTVRADAGDYVFSRLGNWRQPFYDALNNAYNKAVLRALFASGEPVLTAKGGYGSSENGAALQSAVPMHVYENSVIALPPDLGARRVPLCFVTGMEKTDFSLTLRLDTGESYTYSRLGYDTVLFADAIEKQIRTMREKAMAEIRELDPTVTTAQASQLAKRMQSGIAVEFGDIAAIAPSFAATLDSKLAETSAAEYYNELKKMCDPAQIHIGFEKNKAPADGRGDSSGIMEGLSGITKGLPGIMGNLSGIMEGLPDITGGLSDIIGGNTKSGETGAAPQEQFRFWLIVSSPDGRHAVVEFSEADTATFVYRTDGDFHTFARRINRALEAIAFKREVIRLTDDDLKKSENDAYYMANKRTAALQFVRAKFKGRAIHSSPESWKRNLLACFEG